MDPLSIGMMGANVLGGIFSAFGKNERKVSWDVNPELQNYKNQMQSAYRSNMDQAQSQANLGSFLDSKRNMTALNAGAGALAQSGGSYSGQQLNATNAMNAANKAQNYESTLQGQAQAGQMRTQANNELTRNVDNASNYYAMHEEYQPDLMSKMGTALSGLSGSAVRGMGQGMTMNDMMMRFNGGSTNNDQASQTPTVTQSPYMQAQRPQLAGIPKPSRVAMPNLGRR